MACDTVELRSRRFDQPVAEIVQRGEPILTQSFTVTSSVRSEQFYGTAVETSRPRVFVMMPFSEPFDTLYKEVIKPVAEDQLGFEIVRVDEIAAPGIILDDIQRQIAGSHAVVAEISTRNPNVFYELGYAHALGKPAILLVRRQDSAEVPFDIKGYRAIHYDDSIGGKRIVEKNLRAHLEAVKRGVQANPS